MFELGARHTERDQLRPRVLKLRFGLRHRRLIGGAGAVLVAGDAQRFAKSLDRGFQQPLQLVGNAELHIVAGELALRGESGAGHIACARLRTGDIALDRPLDLAP